MELPNPEKIHLYQYDFNDMPMNEMETCAAAVKMFVDIGVMKAFRVPYEVSLKPSI